MNPVTGVFSCDFQDFYYLEQDEGIISIYLDEEI